MMNFALTVSNRVLELPVEEILLSPYMPRRYPAGEIKELAASIRQYGLLQPIGVRPMGSSYELVYGGRRLRAAQLAGIKLIPALVFKVGDRDAAALSLAENLHRLNLSVSEEATAMESIICDFALSPNDLAHLIGKTAAYLGDRLRFLRLEPGVRLALTRGDITEEHARCILRLVRQRAQAFVLEQTAKYNLSPAKTAELVEKTIRLGGERGVVKTKPRVKIKFRDIKAFTEMLKTSLEQLKAKGDASYEILNRGDGYEIKIILKTTEAADGRICNNS